MVWYSQQRFVNISVCIVFCHGLQDIKQLDSLMSSRDSVLKGMLGFLFVNDRNLTQILGVSSRENLQAVVPEKSRGQLQSCLGESCVCPSVSPLCFLVCQFHISSFFSLFCLILQSFFFFPCILQFTDIFFYNVLPAFLNVKCIFHLKYFNFYLQKLNLGLIFHVLIFMFSLSFSFYNIWNMVIATVVITLIPSSVPFMGFQLTDFSHYRTHFPSLHTWYFFYWKTTL